MENQFHAEMKLAREWLLMLLEDQEIQRREQLRQIRTTRLEIIQRPAQPLDRLTCVNMQALSEGGAQ